MPDECSFSLLPVTSCACPEHRGVTSRSPALPGGQRSHPFTARFDGECGGCGFDVRRGETVRYEADGRLVHGRCADA